MEREEKKWPMPKPIFSPEVAFEHWSREKAPLQQHYYYTNIEVVLTI